MTQISEIVSSQTFTDWLSSANKSYVRLNQFAVSESALYANTISANVALNVKGQDSDSRYANSTQLALKASQADLDTQEAKQASNLANTNTYIATKASQADHLAALANTNAYIASMSTDVQLANTNLAIGNLNTNLLATNTAIRLLNTNTQSALDTQEAKQASNLANTNSYIAATATTASAALPKAGGTVTGQIVMQANTRFEDSHRVNFGNANDLSIYHDGNNSALSHSGTGDFYVQADNFYFRTSSTSENAITTTLNGAVDLYHNNVNKFATTSIGVQVKGTANSAINTNTSATGSVTLDFGSYQHFRLTATGNITLANPSTEVSGCTGTIVIIQDGSGSRTLSLGTDYETTSGSGITLSTAAGATDLIPYFVLAPGRILLGDVNKTFS